MRDCMKLKAKHMGKIAAAVGIVNLIATSSAHAYIDPGTAGMAVQALLAVLAAGAATVAVFWQQVKARFGQVFGTHADKGKGEHRD